MRRGPPQRSISLPLARACALLAAAPGCASIVGVDDWLDAGPQGGSGGQMQSTSSGPTGGGGGAQACELGSLSAVSVHSYGSMVDDGEPALALGAAGGPAAILVAAMQGDADLGGVPLTTTTAPDLAVGAYDAQGGHVGSELFAADGVQSVGGIALGDDDDLVIAGGFADSLAFPGKSALLGTDDAYVARLSGAPPRYAAQWVNTFGDGAVQSAHDVAVAGDGDIYLVGSSESQITIFGETLVAGLFLVRLVAGGGAVEWTQSLGQLPQTAGGPLKVVSDSSSRAVVGGRASASDDGFIVRYAANGQSAEHFAFDGEGLQTITDVAVDDEGNIAFSGWFAGSSKLQGATDDLEGDTGDAVLGVLDSTGKLKWHAVLGDGGGDDPQRAWGVTFRGCHVVVVGEASGAIQLGERTFPVSDAADAFWAEYMADTGDFVAGGVAVGDGTQRALAVASRGSEVWIAGVHDGLISFDGTIFDSSTSSNVFLARLAP